MNKRLWTVYLLVAASLAGASSAWAHGGRGGARVGVYFGAPAPFYHAPRYYAPRVYYPPAPLYVAPWPVYGASFYSYPPPVVAVPSAPPTYIEQAPFASAPQQQDAWYWCADPQGYYPTVRECPGGWQPVAPQAPAPR